MLQTWLEWVRREGTLRPRLWGGAGAAALVIGVCGADAQSGLPMLAPDATRPAAATPLVYTPPAALSATATLREAVNAAQSGDVTRARALQSTLADAVARKVVLWAMIDSAGSSLDFFTLDSAQRDLADWPRAARRQAVAEKAMAAANISPSATIAWFASREPSTPDGAMQLASAYQLSGRIPDAQALIRAWWRGKSFGTDAQSAMLTRFGIRALPKPFDLDELLSAVNDAFEG